MKIFEDIKGELTHEIPYRYLYHMTDYTGFSYSVANDTLVARRQNYISTTYDKHNNGINGRMHYDFKFVLDASALASRYGAFTYDAFTTEIGVGGSHKYTSMNEREIGINTAEISPLHSYVVGMVLLFKPLSQRGIQWLLYNNKSTPRAIETLHTFLLDWKKPIWVGEDMHKPTQEELNFFKDVLRIHRDGGNFDSGLSILADKYHIVDHWGNSLDGTVVWRRKQSDAICDLLNSYYSGRRYLDVDLGVVKRILLKIMDILKLGNNISNVVLHAIESSGLLHKATAPVTWASIISDLMKGDVDEALATIHWFADDQKSQREWFDESPSRYSVHVGTMM